MDVAHAGRRERPYRLTGSGCDKLRECKDAIRVCEDWVQIHYSNAERTLLLELVGRLRPTRFDGHWLLGSNAGLDRPGSTNPKRKRREG